MTNEELKEALVSMADGHGRIERDQLAELRQHTALLRLAIIGAVSLSLAAVWLATPRASAGPELARLKDRQAVCAASGGTPVALHPSTAPASPAMVVQNDSATCIRVGGSTVTASTGVEVGIGCAMGSAFSADARNAWCISTSGSTVTVDVVYGDK